MVVSVALLALAAGFVSKAEPHVIVGMLEEPQCKPDAGRAVRVLFERGPSGWVALSDSPPTMDTLSHKWIVAFDGRILGNVRTQDPGWHSTSRFVYARDRLLKVAGTPVPMIVNPPMLFEGWCGAPSARPLVVVSQPNVEDPAGWKPKRFDPHVTEEMYVAFKANVGTVVACASDGSVRDFPYSAGNLSVRHEYADRQGRRLIAITVDSKFDTCDGPKDTAWQENWFVVGEGISYLGDSLSLVDAGDYDKDGQSEVIFWYSGYNKDGYVLFSHELTSRTEYLWKYH